jgi:hypothetical protein
MENAIFRARRIWATLARIARSRYALHSLEIRDRKRLPDVRATFAQIERSDLRSVFAPELYRARMYRDVARLAYQRVRFGACYVGTSGFCCDTGKFSDVRGTGFRSAVRIYMLWNFGPEMTDGPSSAWVAAPSDDGYRYSQAPYGWGVN